MDNRPKRSMDEAASFEIGSVTSLKEEPTQGEEENEDYEFVSKRRRAPGSLSAANEQHLADWFAEQPCFWDHCDANFRNRGKKERMLAKKAVEVGMTGEDLSSWFKSMRTGYGRLVKKGCESGKRLTARQQWMKDNFAFLGSHIVLRTPTAHDMASHMTQVDNSNSDDDDSIDSAVLGLPSLVSDDGRSRLGGALSLDDSCSPQKTCSRSHTPQMPAESTADQRNPRASFAKWLGDELHGLSDQQWDTFQERVFALLMQVKRQK